MNSHRIPYNVFYYISINKHVGHIEYLSQVKKKKKDFKLMNVLLINHKIKKIYIYNIKISLSLYFGEIFNLFLCVIEVNQYYFRKSDMYLFSFRDTNVFLWN